MAIYKYSVEGIYETDKGQGKDYTAFNFEIKLSRFYPEGAGTHILRRFLPMLIKAQKNKPLFSKVKSWLITDTVKISDDFPLEGKVISEMSEQEIQELACMYDLSEIPLPKTTSLTELRNKAMIAYMKKVLKIPMKTPEEQSKLAFFKKQPDGTVRLDLGDEKLIVTVNGDFIGKKVVEKKKTLGDFIKNAGQQVANGILAVTGNVQDESEGAEPQAGDEFPSEEDLANA